MSDRWESEPIEAHGKHRIPSKPVKPWAVVADNLRRVCGALDCGLG